MNAIAVRYFRHSNRFYFYSSSITLNFAIEAGSDFASGIQRNLKKSRHLLQIIQPL